MRYRIRHRNLYALMKRFWIVDFLGLKEESNYSENELETAIINHIESFMLELGRGFFFGGRQVRFSFNEEHFFVDLLFYNRLLKCFVLLDLKIGKLKHQDLGQMQMYINYYDRYVKQDDEYPTIGIILCRHKNDAIVEIILPENNNQLFASKYQTVLPSKEELKKLIEKDYGKKQNKPLAKVYHFDLFGKRDEKYMCVFNLAFFARNFFQNNLVPK